MAQSEVFNMVGKMSESAIIDEKSSKKSMKVIEAIKITEF